MSFSLLEKFLWAIKPVHGAHRGIFIIYNEEGHDVGPLPHNRIIESFSMFHSTFFILCQGRLVKIARFEKGKAMTRNQQIGAWLALTLLLALALYRWFNLP
jgi:hypothetical protein